jgi:peptidoglycan-N-acetylglucosamine deacetylase
MITKAFSPNDSPEQPPGGVNLLTFDVEDWYHINYPVVDFTVFDRREDHQALLDYTKKLSRYCKTQGVQGTFFVLGRLLEKKPQIGQWIIEEGQELALHGYEHDLLTGKNPDQFKRELDRSIQAFRQITGTYPLGYRAPSWSINQSNQWILETLDSFGFLYDSSVFPIKNFLYGISDAPTDPFFPVIRGRSLSLLEIPVSIFRLGARRLAYSGGIYFNLWPFIVIREIGEALTRQGKLNLFYFHPWDLWKRSPDHRRELRARWTSFHLGNTLTKFERLLESFPMGSMVQHLDVMKESAQPRAIGNVHAS